MSYKLVKGDIKLGDITFEDDSDTKIDFEADTIKLTVGGVEAVTVTDDLAAHLKGAAGDILKLENTTAYGVTYGQLVKSGLTISGSSPVDTTLDLPAASTIDTVLVKITTAGAVNSGSTYNITNISVTAGGQTGTFDSSTFSSISLIGGGAVGVGTMYYINNTIDTFPAGAHGTLYTAGTSDIGINYTDTDVRTDAVVDVVVFYRKFDTS
jgi:hypothetical protein